jgi:predicted RNA-binding Zn-ribbon protein involved in translation (DUF1610 family)
MTKDERIAWVRAQLAEKPACDSAECPGWAIFEADSRGVTEIERCDVCCPKDLTDDEVALLPEAQAALAAETGEYPCPECGRLEWRADYYQAVHQGVVLRRDPDGAFAVEDYQGDEQSYDDGASENEMYRCSNCGHEIHLGTFRFVPEEPDAGGTP